MKAIVLGGAGDVGSRAVEDLAMSPGVERVTIADKNEAVAHRLARELDTAPADLTVRRVDANDHRSLVDAIRGHDVVASALGPFYLFESKLVAAAIEAGVDYASVCDEWPAAEAVLDAHAERAKQAGRTVITGLGVSPGLTNLAARMFHEELDEVSRVRVSVYQPLTAGGGEAVLRHMLFIMTGDVAVWRRGRRVTVRACSEQRRVAFPEFGAIDAWNMGHAEPVTIPRFLTGVQECEFFMGFGRGAELFVRPARAGLFGNKLFAEGTVRLTGLVERLTTRGKRTPDPGAVRIDVWGIHDGAEVTRMACGLGEMRNATGLSLSVGAQMLGKRDGVTRSHGVFAPEGCLDPYRFFAHMRDKGLTGYRDLEMTEPVV